MKRDLAGNERDFAQLLPNSYSQGDGDPKFTLLAAFGCACSGFPLGIASAVWPGMGLALISIVGSLYHHQHPDMPAWAGIGLVMLVLLVINLYSKSVAHCAIEVSGSLQALPGDHNRAKRNMPFERRT